ncbi:MAG TPA: penicillin-binding protein activator [Kofleriaceae bacterium]|nr:penicillin-binding protein activator [Kofleriaceae bacterium]
MRAILIALSLIVFVAGCPRQTRKTLTPDVPSHGDKEARSRFLDARSKFLRDGGQTQDFKAIAQDFPSDPIVPWAELYAGIAAVKQRQFPEAEKQLGKVIESNVDPALTARANLFLGIAKNYEGDTAAARKLLAGADKAIENDDERTEFLAAVAYSTAAGDQPLRALGVFDQLYPRVTPTEKALIVVRCQEIVASADRNTLERLFDEIADRKGPAIAAVGSRLVLVYAHDGDAAREQKMRENMVPVRPAVGLPKTITESEVGSTAGGAGDSSLVGAIVPLGSKEENRIAEAAVAGLGLAAGAPDGKGVTAIETRAAIDKTQSAEAVDELARQNAIGIIGPIKGSSVDMAAGRAESLGIPLISLATNADLRTTGKFTFHIRHSPDARARVLAQKALAAGIKTFAVFAPESDYGKGTSKAFSDEVTKGGGKIVTTITYPADTKSFADKTGKLKTGWDAIFIADDAQKLSLIAGALAASGNVSFPLPFPKKKLPAGRPVLVLSLAEGLDASFLASAARQLVGAMLAPGFYPDNADPNEKPFIDRFVASFGRQPGATEAYAYDAAQLMAAAGGGSRAALAGALAKAQLQGVTGAIRFDADHRRADPGIVYSVAEETGGVFAIRAQK